MSHWKELIGGSFTGLNEPWTLVTLWRQKKLTKHTAEPSTGSWSSQVSLSSWCTTVTAMWCWDCCDEKSCAESQVGACAKRQVGRLHVDYGLIYVINSELIDWFTEHITLRFFSCNRQQSTWWGNQGSAQIYSDIRHTKSRIIIVLTFRLT